MHRGLTVDILSQIFIASSKSTKEINHKINRGLIVYIPSWIFLNSSKEKKRGSILKEIGQEINRGLLVHIPPQTSIKSTQKCKETALGTIEDLISIFLLKYPLTIKEHSRKYGLKSIDDLWSTFILTYSLKASGNRRGDSWMNYYVYSSLSLYINGKQTLNGVVREFIVNSLLRSYEQTKAIDLKIHRGVMDYIRSQMASKSLRK